MKRALVVGHRGMLGSDLVKLLGEASGVEVRGADLPDIDITDRASIERTFEAFRPDTVINCAAFTAVDDAESHPEDAMRVNGEGAGNVAAAADAHGAKIVHLSTDFVFDGEKDGSYVETDAPRPLSVYGRTKLAGERRVAASAEDYLIVRTSWLYGVAGRNFVDTISNLAEEKDVLTVVDDQRGSPTYTPDLSGAIRALCDVDARGIVHATGGGSCSWYEFACEIVAQSALETRVRAIKSEALNRPARRPANSVLDTSLLRRLTGFAFPHWKEALARFLKERRSATQT